MFGLHMINEMEKLHREMDHLFHHLGTGVVPEHRSVTPEVQVERSAGGYRLEVALPGIDPDKLKVELLGRQVSLVAESAEDDPEDKVVWHRRERRSPALSRTLTLSEEIDAERVDAEYRNGILVVSLPKAASALPKKISVKAG
ncbi:MAG: Hsp20/alpha crystallin family protein [Desulfuromonadales bacterium]|jgi:HSP20 family protein|nr:Hsp20/alpha crystallin family protein [Desulfuromonadales bacterium]